MVSGTYPPKAVMAALYLFLIKYYNSCGKTNKYLQLRYTLFLQYLNFATTIL
jgi:hypothetical protein